MRMFLNHDGIGARCSDATLTDEIWDALADSSEFQAWVQDGTSAQYRGKGVPSGVFVYAPERDIPLRSRVFSHSRLDETEDGEFEFARLDGHEDVRTIGRARSWREAVALARQWNEEIHHDMP